MPCNIGVRSYAKVEIPQPQPQAFTVKSEAPDIDAELLEKLGIEDPEFLAWVVELDARPLLQAALDRAFEKSVANDIDFKMAFSRGVDFKIDDRGMLEITGRFVTAREKKALQEMSAILSSRWQFEILGIVAELLDYSVTITQKGEEMVLEAEEAGKSHPCDYIKITRSRGISEITFEHFKSRKALDVATAKFLALADKLGVKIALGQREVSEGEAFPGEVRHSHPHSHSHGHGHEH